MGRRRKRRRKRLVKQFEIIWLKVTRGPGPKSTYKKVVECTPFGTEVGKCRAHWEGYICKLRFIRVPSRFAGSIDSIKEWLADNYKVGDEYYTLRRKTDA
jgi:hypothetical protein